MTSWDQVKGGSYLGYGASHEYGLDPGTFTLPIAVAEGDLAANESPVVVVQAYCPYRTRQTTFNAKKQGTPPVLPSPESAGDFVFTSGSIQFAQPGFDASLSTHIWEAIGVYEFVETIKGGVNTGFVLMSLPFETTSQSDTFDSWPGTTVGPGAVGDAGRYAKAGYEQSLSLSSGFLLNYGYNVPAYWPGQFFNDQLINGGSQA